MSAAVNPEQPLIDQEKPVLSPTQINYAREMIDNRHKMKSTPMRVTWPFLNYMCCCLMKKKKKNFNLALKRAIRNKLGLKVPKSDERIDANPFLLLGYGMNSYFEVMVELMVMVGLISLVTVPLMMTFSSFDALAAYPGYGWNQYTLGNIGGADSFCAQSTFMGPASAIAVECPSGTVVSITKKADNTGSSILDFGIIPNTADVNTYCMNSAFTDAANCSSYVNKVSLTRDLVSKCVGQQSC